MELDWWLTTVNEPLHPDLRMYVENGGPMGAPMLRHPLVYSVPHLHNGQANRAYAAKREMLAKAMRKGDIHSIVFLHERPYRSWALIEYVVGTELDGTPKRLKRKGQEVMALAAEVWKDSENLEAYEEEWRAMLNDPGLLMCDDPEGFKALPEWVTIYRGDIDDAGMSWSTSREVAEWFSRRFGNSAPLLAGRVHKSKITGYLFGRGEQEILVYNDNDVEVI